MILFGEGLIIQALAFHLRKFATLQVSTKLDLLVLDRVLRAVSDAFRRQIQLSG